MSLLESAPSSDLSKNVVVCNDLVVRKGMKANVIQANVVDTEDLVVSNMAVEG
jgi:hypothetical protein